MTMCIGHRPPIDEPSVSQHMCIDVLQFLSLFRAPADLSTCPRIIYMLRLSPTRRRRCCRPAPFVYSKGFRHRLGRLSSLLIANIVRTYRNMRNDAIDRRACAIPRRVVLSAVVTTSPENACRLQKPIVIQSETPSTPSSRASDRHLIGSVIVKIRRAILTQE